MLNTFPIEKAWKSVFLANFHNMATKKKGWWIQQRDFWDLFYKNHHIFTKKTRKSLDLDNVFL
jgi:hypothetical protein